MKFIIVEYTQHVARHYGNDIITCYRLFDYEYGSGDAQKFCAQLKEDGESVNVRIREIDKDDLL